MLEQEPDLFEKFVRFVCGLLGGAIFGFVLLIGVQSASTSESVFCMAVSAVVFALGAVKFGDSFWKFIFRLGSLGW